MNWYNSEKTSNCLIFAMFVCVFLMLVVSVGKAIQERKSATLIKQEKFLAEVPFDRVVLYALIALEENHKVRERLFPKVHQDDYFTLILNHSKRLAMADSGRITLPGLQRAAQTDSIKNNQEKETK